jgi:hypothetical protein
LNYTEVYDNVGTENLQNNLKRNDVIVNVMNAIESLYKYTISYLKCHGKL